MVEHPPACREWQEDLAGWLMAQLPPDREARLLAHLGGCVACRAEADSLLAVAALALATDPDEPLAGAAQPTPELGDRIVARVAGERRAKRIVQAGLLFLAGIVVASVAIVALRDEGRGTPLQGEEVAFTVVPAGAQVEALVADDGRGSVVQLTASGLDPDLTYALWLSPPHGGWDDRIAAGTFRPAPDGTVAAHLRCALPPEEYGRLWATTPDGKIALDTE
jgi:predicted anti-sigma-YlaC factor YlaD